MTTRNGVFWSSTVLVWLLAGCCVPWSRYQAQEARLRGVSARAYHFRRRAAKLRGANNRLRRRVAHLRESAGWVTHRNRKRFRALQRCRATLSRVRAVAGRPGIRGKGPGGVSAGKALGRPVVLFWWGRASGGLVWPLVRRVLGRNRKRFLGCYTGFGLKRKPRLRGMLEVRFVVRPGGAVGAAAVTKTTLRQKATEQCVIRALRRIRFPKPRGGSTVFATVRMRFLPRRPRPRKGVPRVAQPFHRL